MIAQQTIDNLMDILGRLGVPPDKLKLDSFLYKDLQLDSTETVEVSLALKRQLGVRIKLETRRDKTLAEICNLIDLSMSEGAQDTD